MHFSSLHLQLKEQTKVIHDSLESMDVPKKIFRGSITPLEYVNYLEVFYRLHLFLEAQILKFEIEFLAYDIDVKSYCRADLLAQDLATLLKYTQEDALVSGASLGYEEIASFEEAIGYLYVFTGSTMGGKILSKKIEENFQDSVPEKVNRYFEAFGDQTDGMWMHFLDFLKKYSEKNPTNLENNAILKGAFECYGAVARSFYALSQ